MENKKPWWKKLLEKMGIIKEQQMLEEPVQEDVTDNYHEGTANHEEEINERIDEAVNEKDKFNDSLKVEIKSIKESVILDFLKSRGVDERLLQNPRFMADIISHIEQKYGEINPDKQIEEVDPKELSSLANVMFEVLDRSGVSFEDIKSDGMTSTKYVNYFIEADRYINTTSYINVPFNGNDKASRITTRKEYNGDGIEVKRESSDKTYEKGQFDSVNGKVSGDGWGSTLTLERQGMDVIYGTYKKDGVTIPNQPVGFNLMIDNRYPEDLYVQEAILLGMKNATSYEQLISKRDSINTGYEFRNAEHKEEYEEYKEALAESMKGSKYSTGLKKIADKTSEYVEKENDDMDR